MLSLTDREINAISETCSIIIPNEPPFVSLKSFRTRGIIPCPRSNFSLCKFSSNQVFLYGGSNDEEDLDDAYILDLNQLTWTKLEISIKFPLVGHSSITISRGLNPERPYIYIFGGWDGSSYSNKGLLINPQTLEVLMSTDDESLLDLTSESSNSHFSLNNSNPKGILRSTSVLTSPTKKTQFQFPTTPTGGEKVFLRKTISTKTPNIPSVSGVSKRITWFPSVSSEKGKSDTSKSKIGLEPRTPCSRRDHTLTIDSNGQKIFLYGGWNSCNSTSDEAEFFNIWILNSNWQWTKLSPKGDIPATRRGHSTIYLNREDSLIIYGGCTGRNGILDDCYEYNVQANCFKKINQIEGKFYPEGRAWHSATTIDQIIYYYGGLKLSFQTTREVIGFDTINHFWYSLDFVINKSIQDIERFSHGTLKIKHRLSYKYISCIYDISFLVFGGSAFEHPKENQSGTTWTRAKEKKVGLEEILVFDTDLNTPFEVNSLKALIQDDKAHKESRISNKLGIDGIRPPPVPQKFKDPKKLLEEQANFWNWNPHIFPEDTNKRKIQYFKQKAEEEARKSNLNIYLDFEGLEDDESVSPLANKNESAKEIS